MPGKFKYRGSDRTVEDVKRAATMSTGNYDSFIVDGFPIFKPSEGENIIRILPPTWPDEEVETWGKDWAIIPSVHYNVGPDGGAFLCLDAMKGEPCPICEARRTATDEEERRQLSANKRALTWLINRNDEAAGPLLWSMPIKKIFKVINARSVDRKSGGLMLVDNPEEGYDVYFNADGAGKMTVDYTGVDVERDPTPLSDNVKRQEKWLAYIQENTLPSVLNWPDPDYIEKVLSGKKSRKADAADGEVEEEEAPFETSARPRRRPVAVEETEEEAAPSRRPARRPVAEEVEEEEEVQDEAPQRRRSAPVEETEEEAPPPRRTARKPAAEPEEEAEPPRRPARRPVVEEEPEDLPAPSRAARAGLERLRPRR